VRALSQVIVAGILLAGVLSVNAFGQFGGSLAQPMLGYAWSSERAVLIPIRGIPGSATVGAPLALGVEIGHATPVDASRVVVSRRVAGDLGIADFATGHIVPVAGTAGITTTRSAVSATGTAVAIHDASGKRIVVLAGLSSGPAVSHDMPLSDPNSSIAHLAVSNDGDTVAYVTDSAPQLVYVWRPDIGTRPAGRIESLSALAMLDGDRLAVASRDTDQVWIVTGLGATPQWEVLAGPVRSISAPVGLVVSGERLSVVNAGSSEVMTFDLKGRYLGTQACDCELTGAYRVRESLYRLTDRFDRTLFLFDGRSGFGRIYFVPPASGL
jgi:hypothetical protein